MMMKTRTKMKIMENLARDGRELPPTNMITTAIAQHRAVIHATKLSATPKVTFDEILVNFVDL
jgi:hypothetical protein